MTDPSIDRSTLALLCELARLHLPQDREAGVHERLQRIVGAFSALGAVGDADAPAAGTLGSVATPTPVRPDTPGEILTPDEVLANASRRAAGAFVVPRVVES